MLPALPVPPLDLSQCCCCLLEPGLQSERHADDCFVQLMASNQSPLVNDGFSSPNSASASPSEDHVTAKRRKHRESMARLRQGWRRTIAALERQKQQLHGELRRAVASSLSSETAFMDPLQVQRQAYCELIHEQLRLQDEQISLEAARAAKETYTRLLQRELERARTFRAITVDSPHDHESL